MISLASLPSVPPPPHLRFLPKLCMHFYCPIRDPFRANLNLLYLIYRIMPGEDEAYFLRRRTYEGVLLTKLLWSDTATGFSGLMSLLFWSQYRYLSGTVFTHPQSVLFPKCCRAKFHTHTEKNTILIF
jgi:hypothetical protein